MHKIFKYPFSTDDEVVTLSVPSGGEILSVGAQSDQPGMWFLVDPTVKAKKRTFRVVGTGEEFDYQQGAHRLVGNVHLLGGREVYHIFEVI